MGGGGTIGATIVSQVSAMGALKNSNFTWALARDVAWKLLQWPHEILWYVYIGTCPGGHYGSVLHNIILTSFFL